MFHVKHQVEFVAWSTALLETLLGDEQQGTDPRRQPEFFLEFAHERRRCCLSELDMTPRKIGICSGYRMT